MSRQITGAGLSSCIKFLIGRCEFGGQFVTVMQINNFHISQAVSYCRGGKVLSSGGSDMGSPFVLQQKTCQAAFQDLSVQGDINSYLGRFIFPSLFMLPLLLSSLFPTGCSFLFHSSCLVFFPTCLSQTFLQVSNVSIIPHLFQEQHLGISVWGLKKPSCLCSTSGQLESIS